MRRPDGDRRAIVAHVLYRLDIGGLENGVVNLIDQLSGRYCRHVIICLTNYTTFARRIRRDDVTLYALNKRPGKDPAAYFRLWRLLRRLRPTIVHTRNLGTLDVQAIAALARVPARVHGEHGWETDDIDARSRRNRRLRRLARPLVHEYVGLSQHIANYLTGAVGIPPARVRQIYNGVDTSRFHPDSRVGAAPSAEAVSSPRSRPWIRHRSGRNDVFVIGTVGRLEAVKNPLLLAHAFARLATTRPELSHRLRLVIIGEGEQREAVEQVLAKASLTAQYWLPGNRDDVPELMRDFDLFVLPSLAEGVSNTILEAMASGVPVVATDVGGNPELVASGETGTLVPSNNVEALAAAIAAYAGDSALGATHGAAGRRHAEAGFSLAAMVSAYQALYEDLLTRSAPSTTTVHRGTEA